MSLSINERVAYSDLISLSPLTTAIFISKHGNDPTLKTYILVIRLSNLKKNKLELEITHSVLMRHLSMMEIITDL